MEAVMPISYPRTLADAHNLVKSIIENGGTISVGKYRDTFRNMCEVRDYNLTSLDGLSEEELDAHSNLDVRVTYNYRYITNGGAYTTCDVTRNLLFYCSGFDKWTTGLLNKVFDYSVPSTIAIDRERNELLIVILHTNRIELLTFGKVAKEQMLRLGALDERKPFNFAIDYDALLEYVDGSEGLNHLRDSLYIELNADVPLRVDNWKVQHADSLEDVVEG